MSVLVTLEIAVGATLFFGSVAIDLLLKVVDGYTDPSKPQVATWGFSLPQLLSISVRLDFLRHWGYRPMLFKRGAFIPTLRAIGSMSPPDYSLARLRPRRAALRFIRRNQLTNAPIQQRSR